MAPICWLERRHVRLPVSAVAGAIIIAVAVAAPWFLAMAQIHGGSYIEGFFVGDNLERFATSRFNDPRPAWFYLPIVAGGPAALDAADALRCHSIRGLGDAAGPARPT